jgi:hypothetical protein
LLVKGKVEGGQGLAQGLEAFVGFALVEVYRYFVLEIALVFL